MPMPVSRTRTKKPPRSAVQITSTLPPSGVKRTAATLREAAARAARRPLRARQVAVAVAYVRFALRHPAHYRVMFGPARATDHQEPAIARPADAAFAVVENLLARLTPNMRGQDVERVAEYFWAFIHGYAILALDGHLASARAAKRSKQAPDFCSRASEW